MEPGITPIVVELGGVKTPLLWTKRSEALLSKHGHNWWSLLQTMRKRHEGFHALCLGIYAAMPAELAPTDYLDLAKPIGDEATQVECFAALRDLFVAAYPKPAEKKSDSKP